MSLLPRAVDEQQAPTAPEPLYRQLAELFDPVVLAPSRHMGIVSTLRHICNRTRIYIYNCILGQFCLAQQVAVDIAHVIWSQPSYRNTISPHPKQAFQPCSPAKLMRLCLASSAGQPPSCASALQCIQVLALQASQEA